MTPRPTHSWIALKPSGCIHDAILHDPAKILSVARNVAEWMRRGFTVEYVENRVVIEALERGCPRQAVEAGKRFEASVYAVNQEVLEL